MNDKLRNDLLSDFGQPMAESFDALSEKGRERFARTLHFLRDDPAADEFVALKIAELEDENTALKQRVEDIDKVAELAYGAGKKMAGELIECEQRVEGLDQIAEDALWHDGHDNPEALEDIRKTVKSLGYTQAAILAAAEEA